MVVLGVRAREWSNANWINTRRGRLSGQVRGPQKPEWEQVRGEAGLGSDSGGQQGPTTI